MTWISSHVLDTSAGRPIPGLRVRLDRVGDGASVEVASAMTDDDGRVRNFTPGAGVGPGVYRLRFETGARPGQEGAFYPYVDVHVRVDGATEHLHVPLLLSPFGYSTYRGS